MPTVPPGPGPGSTPTEPTALSSSDIDGRGPAVEIPAEILDALTELLAAVDELGWAEQVAHRDDEIERLKAENSEMRGRLDAALAFVDGESADFVARDWIQHLLAGSARPAFTAEPVAEAELLNARQAYLVVSAERDEAFALAQRRGHHRPGPGSTAPDVTVKPTHDRDAPEAAAERAAWTRDIARMLRDMTAVPPELRPGWIDAADWLDPSPYDPDAMHSGPDPGPPLTDLVGIDPDMTAGRTPEEHLARLRAGDEPFDELAQRDAEIERLRADLLTARQAYLVVIAFGRELGLWNMLEQAVIDAAKAWAELWPPDVSPDDPDLHDTEQALLAAVADLRAAEDGGGRDDG